MLIKFQLGIFYVNSSKQIQKTKLKYTVSKTIIKLVWKSSRPIYDRLKGLKTTNSDRKDEIDDIQIFAPFGSALHTYFTFCELELNINDIYKYEQTILYNFFMLAMPFFFNSLKKCFVLLCLVFHLFIYLFSGILSEQESPDAVA